MFSSNTSQVSNDVNYIEDVFSTYLYTGNGSTQTITNGIDLAGEGGLTWFKARDVAASHLLFDSARGVTKYLISNLTNAEATSGAGERLTAYNSNGFSLGTDPGSAINASSNTYASWTFRKQPKFFDVVTYTGTGGTPNNVTVSHNLGSTPGFIVTKAISAVSDWTSWHRSASFMLQLNRTDAASSTINNFAGFIDNVTSTSFRVNAGSSGNDINQNGVQYVAYLFAHDAGGFGLTGTDNVISCGSFTNNASVVNVNLGYEPQWVLYKNASQSTGWNWAILDNMRGWVNGGPTASDDAFLFPNLSDAEVMSISGAPTATGFRFDFSTTGTDTFIYIAIRRGPMKVPTDGTSVFSPVASASGGGTITTGFVTDSSWSNIRAGNSNNSEVASRLTGWMPYLRTASTAAESNAGINKFKSDSNTGFTDTLWEGIGSTIYWNFRRAPGFFDEVCATASSGAFSSAHNLGVTPELVILKPRSEADQWYTYHTATDRRLLLNSTAAGSVDTYFTVSASTVAMAAGLLGTSPTLVAYLFASCPGVSKVGSYTGTGTTQQINCGFTSGARFIMVKSTSTTGDWIVVDTARGLVSGNDPTLALNSTAAEVTTNDWFDPYSAGFELSSVSGNLANTNGTSYIYLAIA